MEHKTIYDADIAHLISQMSLEEKVSQLSYTSPAIERLGIPAYNWWSEALHGIARAGEATVFPQAIGMAASFDEDLVRTVASAISDEGRAKYNEASAKGNREQYYGLTFWSPNINIFRDPRWGRGQETWGEDPYLTGRMGLAFVQGMQGDDTEKYAGEDGNEHIRYKTLKTAACAKHYAVHSGPEKIRHNFDAVVSQKDFWETYLPAFRVLAENGVEAFMGAYNRTLGEPCNGSKLLLQDILLGKWGFEGHIVSDCWAIQDFHAHHHVTNTPEESAALALNNGCDLNCGCTYPMLTLACKEGLVTEAAIDKALTKLLRTRFKLGMFEKQSKYDSLSNKDVNTPKNRALSYKAAVESIVLLKNDENLLPLNDEKKSIALIGPAAADILALLGNYYGINSRMVTILEGISAKVAEKPALALEYRQASLMYGDMKESVFGTGDAAASDSPAPGLDRADIIIACYGLDGAIEGEEGDAITSDSNGDRDTIELPPWQLSFLRRVRKTGKKVILVLTGGSAIAFPPDIADAILFVWYPGEEGGKAVADCIFGDAVPGGKLPLTFPASTSQLPAFEDYDMDASKNGKGRTYKFMQEKPLYPFGYGLSYSDFKYSGLATNLTNNTNGVKVDVSLDVANTGKFDADEVVQIYVSKVNRGKFESRMHLADFKRVSIPKGTSKKLEFTLGKAAFETVNDKGESVLESGEYEVIASSAAPIEWFKDIHTVKTIVKINHE
ncbi:MAG: glycoside hydrolase family 3 C-terminal domain-containing protein [Spirochaetaceae bacterium]|jgi:beta-glucosidase|nr:glycoside hydrolase family 3 C-terminal domain-containing protein [Spirochaetaceae bacterium]